MPQTAYVTGEIIDERIYRGEEFRSTQRIRHSAARASTRQVSDSRKLAKREPAQPPGPRTAHGRLQG